MFYYVPTGSESALFGNGVVLKVTLSWNGTVNNLYFNDVLVQSGASSQTSYPNWTGASGLDLGAYEFGPYGGYNSLDDAIAEFTVWSAGQ